MWQNKHLLRGLRVFTFVPAPNPESRFQRETLSLWTLTIFYMRKQISYLSLNY